MKKKRKQTMTKVSEAELRKMTQGSASAETNQRENRLVIKFLSEDTAYNPLCGWCGTDLQFLIDVVAPLGPAVCLEGTEDAVCSECAKQYAPELQVMLDIFYGSSKDENIDRVCEAIDAFESSTAPPRPRISPEAQADNLDRVVSVWEPGPAPNGAAPAKG
jgi:hypothetical protein